VEKSNVAISPSQLILSTRSESPARMSSLCRHMEKSVSPSRVHVRQTSLLSYLELRKEDLGKKQLQVFEFISEYPGCSDREIVKGTGLEINCVCGRRNELVKMGYVVDDGVKHEIKTNRIVTKWRTL
jgi:hypothetical protein